MAVTKRGEVWEARVRVGKDPRTGKWMRKSATADAKAEAEKLERRLLAEAEGNRARFVDPTKETVAEYAARWLEDRKRDLRPGTWERYDTLLRRQAAGAVNAFLARRKAT